jgi:hypothetical protein
VAIELEGLISFFNELIQLNRIVIIKLNQAGFIQFRGHSHIDEIIRLLPADSLVQKANEVLYLL